MAGNVFPTGIQDTIRGASSSFGSSIFSSLEKSLFKSGSSGQILRGPVQGAIEKKESQGLVGKVGGKLYNEVTDLSYSTTRFTAASEGGIVMSRYGISIGGTFYSWTQGMIWFILGIIFVRFIPLILEKLGISLSFVGGVFKWVSNGLGLIRKDLRQRRQGKWYWGPFVLIDIIIVFLLVLGGFITASIQCVVELCKNLCLHHYLLFSLVVGKLVFDVIEWKYTDIVAFINTTILVGETATNVVFGAANKLLAIRNLTLPWLNEQWRTNVDTFMIIKNEFFNEDGSLFGGFSGLIKGADGLFPTNGGRRLDDAASIFDSTSREELIKEMIVVTAESMYFYHKFTNLIVAFQLALLHPVLFVVVKIFTIIFPKFYCAVMGGPCAPWEIFNFGLGYLVDFLNAHITLFSIPHPQLGCGKMLLPFVNADYCGGRMNNSEPLGAFYENLSPSQSVLKKRLLSVHPEKILHCERRLTDGVWVERFGTKILHESPVHPCPLTKRAFHHDPFVMVTQMNQLDIIEHDCYLVCTVGIYQEHCYHGLGNVTRVIKGKCSDVEWEQTHEGARRHLSTVFPSNFFHWTEVATTTTTKKTPIIRDLTDDTIYTQTEAASMLHDAIGNVNVFQSGNIQCDLTKWPSPTMDEFMVQFGCYVTRYFQQPRIRAIFNDWMNGGGGGTTRRLLTHDTSVGNVDFHHLQLKKATDQMTGFLGDVQSLLRVYSTTSRDLSPKSRLFRTLQTRPSFLQVHQPSIHELFPSTNRRRLTIYKELAPPQLGECGMEYTIPCACRGGCVKTYDDLSLCQADACDTNPDATWFDKYVHKPVQDLATVKFNLEDMLTKEADCYTRIQQNPSLDPLFDGNLRAVDGIGTADYCLGFSYPITYRLPQVETLGITRYITNACYQNYTNECVCGWYRQSFFQQEAFTYNFLSVSMESRIINGLIEVQWLASVLVFSLWPMTYWAWLWEATFLGIGDNIFPTWFIYVWSDLGNHDINGLHGWLCWGLHLGSLFTLNLLVVLTIIFVISFIPLGEFIWSLRSLFRSITV